MNESRTLVKAICEKYGTYGNRSAIYSYSLRDNKLHQERSTRSFTNSEVELTERAEDRNEEALLENSLAESKFKCLNLFNISINGEMISEVGDHMDFTGLCANLVEADLSRNEFSHWSEIKKILTSAKNLKFLNLSSNCLLGRSGILAQNEQNDKVNSALNFFASEWNDLKNESNECMRSLVLNGCFIQLEIVGELLKRVPNLSELHLGRNEYCSFECSPGFFNQSVTTLFLNDNAFSDFDEICKVGRSFPYLESLSLVNNPLKSFGFSADICKSFANLECLSLSQLQISEWSVFERLAEFHGLKSVRMQGWPLFEGMSDEQRFFMTVACLPESTLNLNGSRITREERDQSQRKFIRHFMDRAEKPARYFELERIHGKLNKLAEVCLKTTKSALVMVKFGQKQRMVTADLDSTVGEFKKSQEEFVGHASSKFRVFYVDFEAKNVFGPEELRFMSKTLKSLRVKNGDEFEIDLK